MNSFLLKMNTHLEISLWCWWRNVYTRILRILCTSMESRDCYSLNLSLSDLSPLSRHSTTHASRNGYQNSCMKSWRSWLQLRIAHFCESEYSGTILSHIHNARELVSINNLNLLTPCLSLYCFYISPLYCLLICYLYSVKIPLPN